jgi:hypothetical protein
MRGPHYAENANGPGACFKESAQQHRRSHAVLFGCDPDWLRLEDGLAGVRFRPRKGPTPLLREGTGMGHLQMRPGHVYLLHAWNDQEWMLVRIEKISRMTP